MIQGVQIIAIERNIIQFFDINLHLGFKFHSTISVFNFYHIDVGGYSGLFKLLLDGGCIQDGCRYRVARSRGYEFWRVVVVVHRGCWGGLVTVLSL